MFSDNLSRLRKQKGYTQVDFAKVMNVTQSAVSHWESGRSFPDAPQMLRIAECLGVTVDDMMSDTPVPHKETPPQPPPKVDIMVRSSTPDYISRLNPENRAALEQYAKFLFEQQQK